MKILVVSGSHRAGSETHKVGDFIAKKMANDGHAADVYDLGASPLPFWDDGMWSGGGEAFNAWQKLKPLFVAADAFVFVTPEWNGMVTPALKNLFMFLSAEVVAHKPAMLVAVTSGGTNGAYPIAEMRMTASKNNKMVFVPDHLIVRNAGKIFMDNPEDTRSDAYMRERLDYSAKIFYAYAEALKPIRESDLWQTDKFGFGM